MPSASDVVHTMMQAALKQDLNVIVSCLHPDVICVEPESLAYGGVTSGRDAFLRDVYGAIMTKCAMSIAGLDIIGPPAAENATVAVSMTITFTSRKTSVALVMPYVELYEVVAGTIRKIRVYPQDTQRLVEFWNAN